MTDDFHEPARNAIAFTEIESARSTMIEIGSIEATKIYYCKNSDRFLCLDTFGVTVLEAFQLGASLEDVQASLLDSRSAECEASLRSLWDTFSSSIVEPTSRPAGPSVHTAAASLGCSCPAKHSHHYDIDCGPVVIRLSANSSAAQALFPLVAEFFSSPDRAYQRKLSGQICFTGRPDGTILKSVSAPGHTAPEVIGSPKEIFVAMTADLTEMASDYTGSMGVLHAATLMRGDQTLILCNPSGSGKTTLAWLLTRVGFTLLHDDVLPIRHDGSLVQLLTPSTLKSGSWHVLARAGIELHQNTFCRHRAEVRFRAIRGVDSKAAGAKPSVLFVTYDGNQPTRLRPLPKLESFSRLIAKECVIRDRSGANLRRLVCWVAKCRPAKLRYRNASDAIALIDEWLCEPR